MDSLDSKIFGGKKFNDLLEEIYNNQKRKEKQISSLIGELKPLVQDIGDATLIVPLIAEYLEMGVKNDEQLIKMATIIQRCLQNTSPNGDGLIISEEEKAQILDQVNKLSKNNER